MHRRFNRGIARWFFLEENEEVIVATAGIVRWSHM